MGLGRKEERGISEASLPAFEHSKVFIDHLCFFFSEYCVQFTNPVLIGFVFSSNLGVFVVFF